MGRSGVAAMALQRAFPRLRLFGIARGEIDRLVELLADDAATRTVHRLTVAEAMLTPAQHTPPSPTGALAAGGSTAGRRVRRLIAAPQPLGRARMWLGSAGVALVLAVPLLLLSGPAATAMR